MNLATTLPVFSGRPVRFTGNVDFMIERIRVFTFKGLRYHTVSYSLRNVSKNTLFRSEANGAVEFAFNVRPYSRIKMDVIKKEITNHALFIVTRQQPSHTLTDFFPRETSNTLIPYNDYYVGQVYQEIQLNESGILNNQLKLNRYKTSTSSVYETITCDATKLYDGNTLPQFM